MRVVLYTNPQVVHQKTISPCFSETYLEIWHILWHLNYHLTEVVGMTTAEIIQIVIGILSLVVTIAVSFLIYWLQTRHEKEIQKLQDEKGTERIRNESTFVFN